MFPTGSVLTDNTRETWRRGSGSLGRPSWRTGFFGRNG